MTQLSARRIEEHEEFETEEGNAVDAGYHYEVSDDSLEIVEDDRAHVNMEDSRLDDLAAKLGASVYHPDSELSNTVRFWGCKDLGESVTA